MLVTLFFTIFLVTNIPLKVFSFCVEGYIMDVYCIERGTFLDAPTIMSLEKPNEHSMHCLVDPPQCVNSGYEVVTDPPAGETTHCRSYRLDSKGNTDVVALARTEGKMPGCTTCTNPNGTIEKGFKAAIIGDVDANSGGDKTPKTLVVTQVLSSSVGCTGQTTLPSHPCLQDSGGLNTPILAHGSLMLIGWGIILPMGVIFAALLKHRPNAIWFKMHVALQIFGIATAFSSWVVALVFFSVFSDTGIRFAHGVLGMITMCLGLLQPINALVRPHPPEDGEKKSTVRLVWEIVHKASGYLAVILSICTIWIGTTMVPLASDQVIFQGCYGAAMGLLLILIGVLLFDKMKYEK